MSVEDLQKLAVSFAAERDWGTFHDPKNLAMALAAEVGELNALLRWVPNVESDQALSHPAIRLKAQHEIADIAILLLVLCHRVRVDLSAAVIEKLEINARNYPRDLSKGNPERIQ